MKSFLVFAWGISMSLSAQIVEITTIEDVSKFVHTPKGALCIFDVDYTLTMPKEPACQMPNIIKYIQVFKAVYEGLSDDVANLLKMHIVGDGDSIMIEEGALDVLQQLKNNGSYLMAFTAANRTHQGNGDWRNRQLESLGIHFHKQEIALAPESEVYHKGVLYGNFVEEKGGTLIKWLSTAYIKPQLIVAVDDDLKHLKAMERELQGSSVEFVGLHYKGAKQYKSQEVSEEQFKDYYKNLRKLVE